MRAIRLAAKSGSRDAYV